MPLFDSEPGSQALPLRATARQQGLDPVLVWNDEGTWRMQDREDTGIWVWDDRTQKWRDCTPPAEWMED